MGQWGHVPQYLGVFVLETSIFSRHNFTFTLGLQQQAATHCSCSVFSFWETVCWTAMGRITCRKRLGPSGESIWVCSRWTTAIAVGPQHGLVNRSVAHDIWIKIRVVCCQSLTLQFCELLALRLWCEYDPTTPAVKMNAKWWTEVNWHVVN